MLSRSKSFIAAICMLTVASSAPHAFGQSLNNNNTGTGKLAGAVYNMASGDPLVKATVEVVGRAQRVLTGTDGDFTISLEPGTYSVKFSREGFIEQVVDDVVIAAGETKELSSVLSPVGYGESITVSAESNGSITAMIEDRKSATTISDTISSAEIGKDTASSAAGVIQRAPGVSIQNRFVFVRGLGERYSNTSMNDALVPTTEPDRKVVPMDLVPSALLESVKILKTFTPDQPGEFSGGLVKLETVELPRATTLSASFSFGFNSATMGQDFLGYPGGGARDFFGFGRGKRALPSIIPARERVLESNRFFPGVGFTPAELETFSEAFQNIWEPRSGSARPEVGWSFSGGRSFGKFGLIGALSFKNEVQTLDEIRNFYSVGEDGLFPQSTYDYDSSARLARLGGVLNLTYQLTPNHKLFLKNFLTNQAMDEARVFQGFNNDRGTDFRNTRLRYVEERIFTSQLSGDHLVSWLGDSLFAWRYSYARATLDEPGLRETLYEFSPAANDFIYLNQTQSLFRLFNEMRENLREPAVDWSKYWFFKAASLNTKAGVSYINRDRLFDSRRFRFVPRNLAGLDLTQSPEQLLVPGNLGDERGFLLREETRTTDHYDALQNIKAGYLMADFTLKRLRFIGGARLEESIQRVNTFEPFDVRFTPVQAELKNRDLLPSIGVAYSFNNGEMNLRGGYSRTVARPQFRELSPFEFTDVTGGFATVGNPDLKRTLISNYDLRYEWFYAPTELFAVSVFHKDLENPIETVVEATAALRKTFFNADEARNTGLELETRNDLGKLWDRFENLTLNFNYTYVRSRVKVGGEFAEVLTSIERPLVGQSENVMNAVLGYEIPQISFETRALFNYTGKRIIDVGAFQLPDIVEKGRPNLDLLFAKGFGEKRWRAEFTVENVLNRRVDYRQGDELYRVYRRGRTFEFGVSYRIF